MSRREAAVIPSANRGSKFLNRFKTSPAKRASVAANVDFLRFTAPHALVLGDSADVDLVAYRALDFIRTLAPQSGLCVEEGVKAGRRGYAHHVQILTPDGSACGDVCWGGENQKETVSIELTGAACARIEAVFDHDVAWSQVRALLETVEAKITRVDVCHDDYKGERGLDLAQQLYDAGEFVQGGRPPAANRQGWNDGSGMTLYIGKPTGRSQLVVYEKGREQGYRDGEEFAEWVRWEGRFYHRKGHVIPLDLLSAPAEYLVGKYPAMSWVSAVMCRIQTAVVRTKANLQSAMRHCQRQYGGLLNFLTGIADDAADLGDMVASFLTRPTVPAWVTENPFGTAVARDAHPLRICI
ncbi:replication initiation factor [Luteibacter rhizovicinus]|uniref:Replication initiation factor n=1 Tax=Luteibacter rhizovicinus TaxID=242606 RepID=A0A4R3YX36_9GAMM|nr:replication initiation factor domain-containing protein [Luteibacter rhizovicinus]TCV97737.1 replication initiation factor [Luteibacter rhizovicinus]